MSNYTLTSPIDVKISGTAGQINLFNTTKTFAVQIKTPNVASNVDFTLPSTNGITGQFLQRTGASSLGWVNKPSSGSTTGKSIPCEICFNIGNLPSSSVIVTASNVAVGYFMYNGSTINGAPTNFSVVYSLTSPDTGRVYITDITHSNNIIVDTGTFSTPSPTGTGMISISTFTNVPTTQSLFCILATGTGAGLGLLSVFFS